MRCLTIDFRTRTGGLACGSTLLGALALASNANAAPPKASLDPDASSSAQPSADAQPQVKDAASPAEAAGSKDPKPSAATQVEEQASDAGTMAAKPSPAPAAAGPSNDLQPPLASPPAQKAPAKPLVGTPLPPPPPSLPAAKIARGVWRGKVRLDAALNWSLPVPTSGTHRASGDLFGFGAELAASVRALPFLGLGLRWAVSPHQNQGPNAELSWLFDARSANRLMFTARGYWPSKGRLQPFGEVAGGLLYLNAFAQEPAQRGPAWSASLGLDGMILPGWTLWGAARYRGVHLYQEFGHRLELALGASLHF